MRQMRRSPLLAIGSIKTKWSLVIIAAIAISAATSQLGLILGWPVWIRPFVAGALAIAVVQILAKGMTSPLRAMTHQARQIAAGHFHERVHTDSNDEIGQLAESLNEMAEQLAKADHRQREFIANAAHELRTPVAALQNQLENIVDRVTEPTGEVAARMLQQAEHLSSLVNQLLDLSRLEATTLGPDRELVAGGVVLKQVLHEAQLLHPGAVAELTLEGPLGVSAEPTMLNQLFTNLVSNALRFAPIGSPVAVTATGDGDQVIIEVADQGPGIPPELRTRVFERFWQQDRSGPTGGGAGLGLAICQRIAELHSGRISIHTNRSTAQGGTIVRVVLPVK